MLPVPILLTFLLAYLSAGRLGITIIAALLGGVLLIGKLSLSQNHRNCTPLRESAPQGFARRVQRILDRAGVGGLEVYTIDDYIPNAFSYGKRVVLSLGLFEILDDDEILGVVAHEVGHVKNKDTLIFPLVAYFRVFMILSSIALFFMTLNLWVGLLALFLYVWYEFERSKFLKDREFKADYVALHLLDTPLSLKRALEELKYYEDIRAAVKNQTLPGIEPSIERKSSPKKRYWTPSFIVFPTHPSYDERIFRIVAYSHNFSTK
ncbi:zinc metallopeptidase [Thermococcus profundus]|uniref:Zinc metallopeptidase n=1 Tax=Thermococcus profundus TaxID=49899 RepID=A0A2Z2MKY9_THEPR|nr:M48 family metallopeptidase [Thermococcus profundus]ASJ02628.1 zinc metallopeptidase [Thermococcus profundus]